MKDKNPYRMTIQLTDEEEQMLKTLKEEHSINISHLVKKSIRDLYKKLEK